MQDLVFFKKEGEDGVALTSTSANHISNMAKEYIQSIETVLNNISFIDESMSLIGGNNTAIHIGTGPETLNKIQEMLDNVANAKSLIAWFREAIKTKESLNKDLQNISIEEWCENYSHIQMPEVPKPEKILTKEEYFASLSVKDRNRYYQLETIASVYGKYIHPDGVFADARKEVKDKIQNPHRVSGTGRDALIYHYTPSVNVDDVDKTFYELQKKHREIQAQLNSIKHECELAVNKSLNISNTNYTIAMKEYSEKYKTICQAFKTWKDSQSQIISALKIVIPNSLLGIYNIVNSLGK